MTLDTAALDATVAKFRKASPNIAAAFDETKKLLLQLDGRLMKLEGTPTTPPPTTGNVIKVNGTISPAALAQQLASAPAGAVTVQPADGQTTFTVSGDFTLSRQNVTIRGAKIRDFIAHAAGSGFVVKDSEVHSFLLDGANDWTIDKVLADFKHTSYGPQPGFDLNGGSIMFNCKRWKIVNNSKFMGCVNDAAPEQHTEAWYIGTGNANGLIDGCWFDDNGTTGHLFFTWWSNSDPASYPREICVRNNKFTRTRNRWHHIDMRQELTAGLNIKIDPNNQWDSSGAVLAADSTWVRPC